MAELVAAILAIADASVRLSTGLFQVASALRSAGDEVRAIAYDTTQFSQTLRELSSQLSTDVPAVASARSVAEEVIASCNTIHRDGEELLRVLKPLVEKTPGQIQRMFLRVRWLFERSKFAYHRDRLGSLKNTLQLLVSVIILQTVPNKADHQSLVDQVVKLRHVVEAGVFTMAQHLQTPQILQAFQPGAAQLPAISNEGSTGMLAIVGDSGFGPEVSEIRDSEAGSLHEASTSSLSRRDNSAPELGTIHGEVEEPTARAEPVGPLALVPYFRAYFAQEKVCRYTDEALHASGYDRDGVAYVRAVDQGPASASAGLNPGHATKQAFAKSTSSVRSGVSSSHEPAATVVAETPAKTRQPAEPATPREAGHAGTVPNHPPLLPSRTESTRRTNIIVSADQHLGEETPDLYGGDDEDSNLPDQSLPRARSLQRTGSGSSPFEQDQRLSANPTLAESPSGLSAIQGAPGKGDGHRWTAVTEQELRKESGESTLQPASVGELQHNSAEEFDADVVLFLDYKGREIQMPFRQCRTYENLLKSILQYGFQGLYSPFWREKISNYVYATSSGRQESTKPLITARFTERGEFRDLSPRLWEQQALPDTIVRLHLYDDENLQSRFASRTQTEIASQEMLKRELQLPEHLKGRKPEHDRPVQQSRVEEESSRPLSTSIRDKKSKFRKFLGRN